MKRLPLLVPLALLACASLACAREVGAQGRADGRGFGGSWNYAVYARDKSELPPAYQSMKLEEVPAFAIDITIRQSGNRLRATCGVAARFLARLEDCGFTATARNGVAQFRLPSGFGGTATVRLTLRDGKLRWQTVRRTGVSYFPDDVTLRRLKPGEIPPYFEKEDTR
ncbi:MAG: hypothetical protein LC795_07040 [Acidobacteria bacterium]|nr:hypothetical protein [Acidobacteriota bacterium]